MECRAVRPAKQMPFNLGGRSLQDGVQANMYSKDATHWPCKALVASCIVNDKPFKDR